MPKPFDATLNALIDAHLADWAAFLTARVGVPGGPAVPLDTDLSATLQADRLFRVEAEVPYAIHLELESTGRLGIPFELLRYNIAAHAVTSLPIHSVLVLLRPKANASDQVGNFEMPGADGRAYLTFRYTVVRIWEESVEGLLAAGLGFAPLTLLTNEAAADLPRAFERLLDRLKTSAVPGPIAKDLLGSTFWLGGLRYTSERLAELYRRLSMTLEDSTTYQWVKGLGRAEGKAEGKAEGQAQGTVLEAQSLILRLGAKRFACSAPVAVAASVQAITDREQLERIADRLLDVAGWNELLATE